MNVKKIELWFGLYSYQTENPNIMEEEGQAEVKELIEKTVKVCRKMDPNIEEMSIIA